MNLRILSILLLASTLYSCDTTPVQQQGNRKVDPLTQPLLETNKYLRERNREMIKAFVSRNAWDMRERPSGLWIDIQEKGSGKTIEIDDHISYIYRSSSLDGMSFYESTKDDPKKILAGKGNIEAGLEEALLYLKEGSIARIILPPYLAHGNFGDGKKIPGATILVVEIEILTVK